MEGVESGNGGVSEVYKKAPSKKEAKRKTSGEKVTSEKTEDHREIRLRC